MKSSVVGGFFFLRGFTPAVVSPEGFGVIDAIDPTYRRPLVLVSKILQNISNAVDFKEEYMFPLNDFVHEYIPLVTTFFDQLSETYFDNSEPLVLDALETKVEHELLHRLHFQLQVHLTKIGTILLEKEGNDAALYSWEYLLEEMWRKGPSKLFLSQMSASSAPPAPKKKKDVFKVSDFLKKGKRESTLHKQTNRSSVDMSPISTPPRRPASLGTLKAPQVQEEKLPKVAEYPTQPPGAELSSKMFGVELCSVLDDELVAVVVEDTVAYLEQYGLEQDGIFLAEGSASEVAALQSEYDKGERPNLLERENVLSIAHLLKLFFQKLPHPPLLMTQGLKEATGDRTQLVEILIGELSAIPDVNYYTLWRLFGLFSELANHKMTAFAAGEIWAPVLHLPVELAVALIVHFAEIFENPQA